jgi:hypothetical protein
VIGYSVLFQGAYTRQDRPLPAQYEGPEACDRLGVLANRSRGTRCDFEPACNCLDAAQRPTRASDRRRQPPDQLAENLAALDIRLT